MSAIRQEERKRSEEDVKNNFHLLTNVTMIVTASSPRASAAGVLLFRSATELSFQSRISNHRRSLFYQFDF